MSAAQGTFRLLTEHLAHAVEPVGAVFGDIDAFRSSLLRLGWSVQELPQSYSAVADAAVEAVEAANALGDGADIGEVLGVISKIGAVYHAANELTDAPVGVDAEDFMREFPRQFFEMLFAEYLAAEVPGLFSMLEAIGVIGFEDVPPLAGRPGFVRTRFAWETLAESLVNLDTVPSKVFGWGLEVFDFSMVAEVLTELCDSLDIPSSVDGAASDYAEAIQGQAASLPEKQIRTGFTVSVFDHPVDDRNEEVAVSIYELPAEGDALPGILIRPRVCRQTASQIDIGGGWAFYLRSGTDPAEEFAIVLRPGETLVRFPFAPGHALSPSGYGATLTYNADQPVLLFGELGNTRLELARASFSIDLDLVGGDPDLRMGVRPDGLTLVLSAASLDNFIGSVLGTSELGINVPMSLGWSSRGGLDFLAGAGFEILLYPNMNFAAVRIDSVYLAVKFSAVQPPQLALEATASLSGAIGPIVFSVDRFGIGLPMVFEDGNAGPFDVAFEFIPPAGLGLGVEAAGVVSGGGFLYIDPDADGEYAGVLELNLLTVGINAVGLVDTKLPNGGWSLFFALFIDVPAIPLGFGFTLNGVGGVAGVNRDLDTEGLQAAIRSGSLDNVLFPEDPIRDAPMVIDAMQAIFPSAEGRYVFGPVIQIGWGTPTLIEGEIGIVIVLPDPIVIAVLGSVSTVLPTREVDLVALHLEVAGVIDTGAGTLSIDSSLHGSHIAGFPLSGDMALRSAFGGQPTFLMALGGSHPGFDRPDKFPKIDRLSLAINAGKAIDIRFDCYFAVAANSLQFGAAFEMTAEVEGFGINGGASFDALINFSPFSLQTDLGYHISVKAAGVDLLGVWLDVTLSGPNPWHVAGTATFTILGIDNTIKLDETIGAKEHEMPPENEDLLDQLRSALALPESWRVGSGGGHDVVFAGEELSGDELVVTPDGTLGVSQRVVPLGLTIDKGEPWQIVGGYDRFDLEADVPGLAGTGSLMEWFVVSSYKALSPRERLSAPSFDLLKAGIEFGGGEPTAGDARTGTLEYEQILRDPELDDSTVQLPRFNLSVDPRAQTLGTVAFSKTIESYTIADDDSPPIELASAGFAVTDRLTGAVLAERPTWTECRSSSAGRKEKAAIVPAWEVAA
jgi:hypothetical protein